MASVDPNFFYNLTSRRGFYGGSQEPIQRMDFNFGEAGLGGVFNNPMAPMVMQPMINAMFGHGGVMPAQFSPQQGLYDQMLAKSYYQAHQAAMATAAQADRETTVQMLRGMAQIRGTHWGLDQQRSANVMAGDMAFMAPFMAQGMPEIFDAAHGMRGSATVMASFLHRGGRTAMDPVSGQTGMSGVSAGVLASEISRRFFSVDADLGGWRGISAGRAGAMYDELQTRGLMGMSIGAMTPAEQIQTMGRSVTSREDMFRLLQAQAPDKFATITAKAGGVTDIGKLAQIEGLATGVLQDLQKTDSTKFEALLRQTDANQIGNRLKSMSGAVTAMREIFGDMGHPNAPMSQLIEGLNQLTQGGLATMSPGQLEQTVRSTQVIARTSGMGMQGLANFTMQGIPIAQAMGLNPRFAVTAAQGAAEFGAAYAQVGRGDVAAWGRQDLEHVTQVDRQLRLNAANAPMSQRMGALMHMVEVQKAAGISIEGTPLAAFRDAVMAGESEFTFKGTTQSMNMDEGRARQIAMASGFTGAAAHSYMRSPQQEQIDRYGIANITRRAQPDEIRARMSQHFHEAIIGQLSEVGITGDQAANIARVASAAQARAMTDMPQEDRYNAGTRTTNLVNATRTAVVGQLVAGGMKPAEAEAEFRRMFPDSQVAAMVESGVGLAQQRFDTDPQLKNLYGGFHNAVDMSNKQIQARKLGIEQENKAQVIMSTALGGIATADPMRRFMEEVRKPSGTVAEAVMKVLGGVDPAVVRERLAGIDVNRAAGTGAGEGGIGVKDRLGVLMAAVVETTTAFEKSQADAKLTPAQKLAKSREYASRIDAIMMGGDTASAELKQALIRGGLVEESDDAATVKSVARDVMRGAKGDPNLVNIITPYMVAGATADAATIRREQESILAREGITTPKDIDRALKGEMNDKISETGRTQLAAWAATRGGLKATAEANNISLKAKLDMGDLASVVERQKLFDIRLTKALPEEGPERNKAIAQNVREARIIRERGGDFISSLIGDTEAQKNLGKGAGELVRRAHDRQRVMRRLAGEHNLDLDKIAAGAPLGDLSIEQMKVVEEIKKAQAEVGTINTKLSGMADRGPGAEGFVAATPEELAENEKYKKWETKSPAEQNKVWAETLFGTGAGGEKDRTALEEALGTGPEHEARVMALARSHRAKQKLQGMAERSGLTLAQLQKRIAEGNLRGLVESERITPREMESAAGLAETAGDLLHSDSAKDAVSTIKKSDELRKAAEAEKDSKGAAGVPTRLTLSGTVTMKGDKLDVGGATAEGMGSTPVAERG